MSVYRILHRRGTAAEWTDADPVLADSERGFQLPDEDYPNGRWKTGKDGLNWSDLPYDDDPEVALPSSTATGRAVLEGDAAAGRAALGAGVVTNMAALKGIASLSVGLGATSGHVRVLGYYSPGDGGGGIFRWDASDTSTPDNGGTVIAPTSGPSGRWKRVYEGAVNARWFGVHPSRSDNTAALQAAVDWVSAQLTGGVVFIPCGYHRFTFSAGASGLDTITVAADGVFICGEGQSTVLTIRDHTAVSDEVDYFFTFSQATRGNGGGVKNLTFDGYSQLTWCVKLNTWRNADFGYWARDVHGGLLDAYAESGTEILGENIRVRGMDYSMSSGVNACIAQYGVRFRPSLSASWADSFIEDSIFVGVWDTGVELDGVHRFSVTNAHSSWNYSSTNSIDGLAKAGCQRGVRITNRLIGGEVGHWAGNNGHHRIDGVYLESHEGSETYDTYNAVLIDTPVGQTGPNRFNHLYNIDVSSNLPGPSFVKLVDDTGTALTNNNTFTNNRRKLVASQVIVGPFVRDTYINVLPSTASMWQVAIVDSGTNTYINGVANITYRDSSIWPDATPGSGQVDAGCITFDTATGRGVIMDKYNDPHLISPRPGLDVVAPYGPQRIQALPTPPAPKVSVVFAGSTSWSYYLVAVDKDGNRSVPSPVATVTTGPATLNTGSYNWITWNPVEGAVKYDLLRGSTGQSVAINIVGTHFKDIVSSTSAYTPAASNPGGDLTVDGKLLTTGGVEVPQAAVVTHYNTADRTTNYERARQYWNSNIFLIAAEQGGTGSVRPIRIQGHGYLQVNNSAVGPTSGVVQANDSSSAASMTIFGVNGTQSASSGTQYGEAIAPTINQSGTAGYAALLINPTETGTGSGTKRLIDAQVGGSTKFAVDNAGVVTATASSAAGTAVVRAAVPATASSAGVAGQIAWDASHLYVCTATNTWVRAALATW